MFVKKVKGILKVKGNKMAQSETGQTSNVIVNPKSNEPDKVWLSMRSKTICRDLKHLNPNTLISDDKVRFVCISDTHAGIEKCKQKYVVPNGDVLLHAGDITSIGSPSEIIKFNSYLGTLPHRHKIVITGNHDLTFDESLLNHSQNHGIIAIYRQNKPMFDETLQKENVTDIRELFTNCVYLEDSGTEIYGIKIYGSPWQPEYHGWAFNAKRGQECLDKWNLIPTDTDVLITHGPPLGHGDFCCKGTRVGCVELLATVQQRVKPKYHIFGHIHEGYGMTTDDVTTYINASTCDLRYQPINPPIVFDFPLPPGHVKCES